MLPFQVVAREQGYARLSFEQISDLSDQTRVEMSYKPLDDVSCLAGVQQKIHQIAGLHLVVYTVTCREGIVKLDTGQAEWKTDVMNEMLSIKKGQRI